MIDYYSVKAVLRTVAGEAPATDRETEFRPGSAFPVEHRGLSAAGCSCPGGRLVRQWESARIWLKAVWQAVSG